MSRAAWLAPVDADVDLDLLDGQLAVAVRVHRLEVPEEGVDELVEGEPAVGPAAGGLDRLGTRPRELLGREVAALVLVAKVEGLDHGLLELFAVDLAVAVLVVALEPLLHGRRRTRLGHHPAVDQEQAQQGHGGEGAGQDTHHAPPMSGAACAGHAIISPGSSSCRPAGGTRCRTPSPAYRRSSPCAGTRGSRCPRSGRCAPASPCPSARCRGWSRRRAFRSAPTRAPAAAPRPPVACPAGPACCPPARPGARRR